MELEEELEQEIRNEMKRIAELRRDFTHEIDKSDDDLLHLEQKLNISIQTYKDVLSKQMLILTSDSETITKTSVLNALEQIERIAQIPNDFPPEVIEICWDYVRNEDDDISNSALKCLLAIFHTPQKAEALYQSELPSKLFVIFTRPRFSQESMRLFLILALGTQANRESCLNDELTDILLSKGEELANDFDSLANILDIILSVVDEIQSLRENLPIFLERIEESFNVENNHLYTSMLFLIYIVIKNADSEEWLKSFCEAPILTKVLSTLSLVNTESAKLILSILHALIGKGNDIHSVAVNQAIVSSNVFSVISLIIHQNDEELLKYAYDISATLCATVVQFKDLFMSSDLPDILLSSFSDMKSKVKKVIVKMLASISRYAYNDENVCEFVFSNHILMLLAETLDIHEATPYAVIAIKVIIAAGMKLQGTEHYDEFLEQIYDDDFNEKLEEQIEEMDTMDDDDETYNQTIEATLNDLYDINSTIQILKNQ